MKKIVALVGSLRKESINRTVFEKYQELHSDRFEFVEGGIADIPHYNQDKEGESDSANKLAELVAGADGVMFFSPEYNYSIPGVLKNAIDHLSRSDKQPFNGKPAAIIGASPGTIGTARMQYHLRQIGVTLNMHFLNKPEVMIGKASEKIKDGNIIDDETIKHLQKHGESFISFIDKL